MLDLLEVLLSRAFLPGLDNRLTLHAVLHRLCSTGASALQDRLREPDWWRRAAAFENDATSWIEAESWAESFDRGLREARASSGALPLIFCAAVLRTLDRYHKACWLEVEHQEVELPPPIGGSTVFLPPPVTPVLDLVPPNRRLDRQAGDLKIDLRSILQLWWHLVELEDLKIRPTYRRLEATVSEELGRRLEAGDLTLALASPFAQLEFEASSDAARRHPLEGRIPYRFTRISPACLDAARQGLTRILARCAQERVDILCFPELTLDTDLAGHLQRQLGTSNPTLHPALVVAGSFHVDSGGSPVGWVNRCRTLDGFGNLLFQQDKCVPFGIPATQAAAMEPGLRAFLGIDDQGGFEDIQLSKTFSFFDCSLGRLATPICLDFCGDELLQIFVASGANFLLVPAMTPSIDLFQTRARDLGTQARTATFMVNSEWLLRRMNLPAAELRTLAYLPAKGRLQTDGRALLLAEPGMTVFSIRELLGIANEDQ